MQLWLTLVPMISSALTLASSVVKLRTTLVERRDRGRQRTEDDNVPAK
jgi:hypothetical protein